MNKTNLNNDDDNLKILEAQYDDYDSQFKLLLKQYNTSYQEFADSTSSGNQYVTYDASVWWGNGIILQEGTASSPEDCQNMCSNKQGCTGTTYNPEKQYCWVSGGQGNVVPGLDSDQAQLPLIQDKLRSLKSINEQLQDLNTKLLEILSKLSPEYEDDKKNILEKRKILETKYKSLMDQQGQLLLLIKENETLEEQYNNNNLEINQQNALFKIWLFIVVLLLAWVIKLFIKPTKLNNGIFIIILLIICIGIYWHYR